jgi:hypothetical protein
MHFESAYTISDFHHLADLEAVLSARVKSILIALKVGAETVCAQTMTHFVEMYQCLRAGQQFSVSD